MKFVLAPIGSAGDVHPFVWLGKLLRARGHEVMFVAQENVREMPEQAGLPTVIWGDAAEQEEILHHPDLWHPKRAFHLLTRYIPKWAGENMEAIRGQVEEGRTVVIAGALAFGARVLAERTPRWPGVPLLTVHLQPSIFMSVEETPVMMAGYEWLPGAPRWVRRLFFAMANRMIDRKLGKPLAKVRKGVGLPRERLRGIMRSYWHSPDGVLCLFPEWYARKAADWPEQAVTTRFPLYDESPERGEDAGLEAYLRVGERPVVITPGSANVQAAHFLKVAVEACGRVGMRALVATRYPEQVPAGDVAAVRAFKYIPFSQVFPRAAAVIHHGGIGTTAQCFAAGVPQLIMPMAHDQPDNANRIKRLGVGDFLYPKKFHAESVGWMLKGLLESPEVRDRCMGVRRRIAEPRREGEMGELIETLSERALRVRQINGVGVLC